MAEALASHALELWVEKLDREPLPVLPQNAKHLSKLLSEPEVSLAAIATLINRDPVMQVHLISECNRQFGARAAGSLTQIQHCVAMLGLDRLTPLLNSFKTTQSTLKPDISLAYRQAINISLHSAAQAASWTQFRNPSQKVEMHLSALLYGVPNWCLWRFAQPEMKTINHLIFKENIPQIEAEIAVLGCTREAIAMALAKRWSFPPNICAALSIAQLPSPAFLMRHTRRFEQDSHNRMPNRTPEGILVNTPALAITLSNQLAHEVSRDWYSPQTLRCLRITAAYLDQSFATLWSAVTTTALTFSHEHSLPYALAPACGLLWPPQPRRRRKIAPGSLKEKVKRISNSVMALPKAAPKTTPVAAVPTLTPEPDAAPNQNPAFRSLAHQEIFEQFIRTFTIYESNTKTNLCSELIDQLYTNSFLKQVVLFELDANHKKVHVTYSRGCEKNPTLRQLKVALQPTNLLTHLLKKPAACWISPERSKEQAGLVPGVLKQANQCTEYLFMSLFDSGGSFGLLYADRDEQGITDSDYQLFKLCGRTLSQRLTKANSANPL